MEISDKWFVDNGYFKIHIDKSSKYTYEIYVKTEKFKILYDTCRRFVGVSGMITPEVLLYVNANLKLERNERIHKSNYKYVKKVRPEGYLTCKQLAEKRKVDREERQKRHDRKPH